MNDKTTREKTKDTVVQQPASSASANKKQPQRDGQARPGTPAGQGTASDRGPNKSAGPRPKAAQQPGRSAQQGKGKATPAAARGQQPGAQKPSGQAARARSSRSTARPPAARRAEAADTAKVEAAQPAAAQAETAPATKVLVIPSTITVRDLSTLLQSSPINLIRELMKNGIMANINQEVDFETAAIIATDLGFEVLEERPPEPVPEEVEEPRRKRREYTAEELAKLKPRPPVVTIMGHVDHGKTSLLDAIRQANVVASEVGGITQHIGAYQVQKHGKRITFIDTPGHEAFTAMRARGAMVTDIAILVVAADDGVQPQTLEAISHARAAQVPIIVALNKMDKANANPDAVKKQLADHGLLIEDYGGDVICVPVSAKQQTGLDTLLEMILLVAEMAELKANPEAAASGTVIEGRLDKSRGPLATLLLLEGTLRVGDFLVIGDIAGKVRAMFDDKGQRIEGAGPADPAVVLGLGAVAAAGENFQAVADEHTAKSLAAQEASRRAESAGAAKRKVLTLDEFFAQAQAGEVRELNIILKADVQGSIEPIANSVEKLGDGTVKARLLHTGTGNINESDIMLAVASNAIVVGFSVQVEGAATRMAEAQGVDIRVYDIIYHLVDDIDKALKGLLEPVFREVVIGHAELRQTWTVGRKKQILGCQVTDGIAARNAQVRLKRGDQVLFEGSLASLRRFKDDVREVTAGMECGISLDGFDNSVE
ncbi:MAG: translation initiation factor IF-2, partial [Chloroflexi bacterium]|nr:translation initiation factor IF-2 [Chloroflexota bacterium]